MPLLVVCDCRGKVPLGVQVASHRLGSAIPSLPRDFAHGIRIRCADEVGIPESLRRHDLKLERCGLAQELHQGIEVKVGHVIFERSGYDGQQFRILLVVEELLRHTDCLSMDRFHSLRKAFWAGLFFLLLAQPFYVWVHVKVAIISDVDELVQVMKAHELQRNGRNHVLLPNQSADRALVERPQPADRAADATGEPFIAHAWATGCDKLELVGKILPIVLEQQVHKSHSSHGGTEAVATNDDSFRFGALDVRLHDFLNILHRDEEGVVEASVNARCVRSTAT
mmetsp:Transcript_49374/g.114450  ORF Transcript_49374/g.114450 Transcript_49374/m.114450 type:complete len:282 (+) Transcript_49374:398-1243(+)